MIHLYPGLLYLCMHRICAGTGMKELHIDYLYFIDVLIRTESDTVV